MLTVVYILIKVTIQTFLLYVSDYENEWGLGFTQFFHSESKQEYVLPKFCAKFISYF